MLTVRDMSDPLKLGRTQLAPLQLMGFCDPAFKACDARDDGVVQLADQSANYAALEGYREAFEALAALGGKANAIDAADLARLEDAHALAGLVSKDPIYRLLVARNSALEFGKKEIPEACGNRMIPPRHYRRLVVLLQMALKSVVDPSLAADGDYGESTRAAIAVFQEKVGISAAEGKNGKLAGIKTIGRLLMRLRSSRAKLLEELERDRRGLKSMGAFFMGSAEGEVKMRAQGHVVDALKWLGYLRETTDVSTPEGRNEAAVVLQQRFDGANLVGHRIVEQLIERVKALPL